SVGAYVFENFLQPRPGAAAPRGAGPSHSGTQGITAVEAAGLSLGAETAHPVGTSGQSSATATDPGISTAITGSAGRSLPVAQQTVYSSPGVATDTSAAIHLGGLSASRAHGRNVYEVVNSGDSWDRLISDVNAGA